MISMLYNELILSGSLHTVVADLNEQAADRLDLIIRQMMKAEGVTEAMKAENQMLWVGQILTFGFGVKSKL